MVFIYWHRRRIYWVLPVTRTLRALWHSMKVKLTAVAVEREQQVPGLGGKNRSHFQEQGQQVLKARGRALGTGDCRDRWSRLLTASWMTYKDYSLSWRQWEATTVLSRGGNQIQATEISGPGWRMGEGETRGETGSPGKASDNSGNMTVRQTPAA